MISKYKKLDIIKENKMIIIDIKEECTFEEYTTIKQNYNNLINIPIKYFIYEDRVFYNAKIKKTKNLLY